MRIRPCHRLHTPKRTERRKSFRNNASPNGGQCATVIVAQSLLSVRHTLLDATQQLRHHQRVEKLCANCGALLECRQEAGCWCAELPHIATGCPVSPPIRIRGSISISPNIGTPYSMAVLVPSPWPKISTDLPQCGQLKVLIFSTTPSTSTFTWRNISIALRTSASATVDGVVTTTAPVTATVWIRVNCTSPVPGGRSITR